MMTTGFTKKGMNQSTSSYWAQGQKIYTKKNLTEQGVHNYQRMWQLGVGVKLLSVKNGTI